MRRICEGKLILLGSKNNLSCMMTKKYCLIDQNKIN